MNRPSPLKDNETWLVLGPGDKAIARVTNRELDSKSAARIGKWLLRFAEWTEQERKKKKEKARK